MDKSALIDASGKYRYWLSRVWNSEMEQLCFIMLNPSTADAEVDDPTIRRCIDFARRLGFGSIKVVNLFAYRATDPKDLKSVAWPVGADNDLWVEKICNESDGIICAWGNHGSYLNRSYEVLKLLHEQEVLVPCHLGMNKTNEPKHPLYLSKDTLPEPIDVKKLLTQRRRDAEAFNG